MWCTPRCFVVTVGFAFVITGSFALAENKRTTAVPAPKFMNVLFVVDASGQMTRKLGVAYLEKRQRTLAALDLAKDYIAQILTLLPAETHTGLRIVGGRVPYVRRKAAEHSSGINNPLFDSSDKPDPKPEPYETDSNELIRLAPNQHTKILKALQKIQPLGTSPSTYALDQMFQHDLAKVTGKDNLVIWFAGSLYSPGLFTSYLESTKYHESPRFIIVSMTNMKDRSDLRSFEKLAAASGGRFYNDFEHLVFVADMEKSLGAKRSDKQVAPNEQ